MDPIRVDEIQGVWTYLKTIDWTDPWLLVLLGFHVCCSLGVYFTCRHSTLQGCIFLIMLFLVYFSENINEWAAQNWRLFSRQQYFDSKGMFISFLFSFPLLMNCLVIVGVWLKNSWDLLIKAKRLQVKEQSKAKETKEK